MIPHDPSEHVDHMPGVGDLIGGRYRLESVIGHGALGTVMRAQHITMGREVAVKLLRPEISNHRTIRRRLIQRVHQAQTLNHPNNCRLFDFGQAGGSLYLVMELLEGAPLQIIIERGAPYPVGWVLDIGRQILDGLGEAHDHNFVHRNLKPRNIFLLPRRRGGQQVKILDYGLASSLDSLPQDDEDEREAEICGTAAYLAPETLVQQQSGKPTDVYAVALIMIEMLTGRQVFSGDTLAQVLYRQIHTSVRLPAKLAWTSLGKVLFKAVSKHPNNRYQDADAFYEAIEQAAETTPSYFRLDPRDLDPDDQTMPPELLARMMRSKRARRSSDRGGGAGDEEDSDETEPDTSPASVSSGAAEAPPTLIPPPFPVPGARAQRDASLESRRRGVADLAHRPDCSDETGRLDGGGCASQTIHPLRALSNDEEIMPRVSFPRDTAPDDAAGEDAPPASPDDRAASSAAAMPWWHPSGILRVAKAGRFSRLTLVVVALLVSLAGLGLCLTLA